MNKYEILKNLTILIIEDETNTIEELCSIFEMYFKKCYLANDGLQGLEAFKAYNPDIILADLTMPNMSGLDMISAIRDINKRVPIIVTSAFNSTEIFLQCIDMQVSHYIIKPINVKNVFKLILKEADILNQRYQLIAQEELIQVVMDEIPTPVMVVGLEQNILYLNNAAKNKMDKPNNYTNKCYKLLYDRDTPCEGKNQQCPIEDIKKNGYQDTVIHSYMDKNNEKVYMEIKTKPLKNKDGETYAFVEIFNNVSTQQKEKNQLKYQANHDELTGLPNRLLLFDRISHAIKRSDRERKNFALLFLDLDFFKVINDTYGHKIGDSVLQGVTNRILKTIRKVDTLARYAGDEFIILLEELDDDGNYIKIIKNILNTVKKPSCIENNMITIQCSIGIDIYKTNSNKSQRDLLHNADMAMYEAKKSGKNTFCFSTNEKKN